MLTPKLPRGQARRECGTGGGKGTPQGRRLDTPTGEHREEHLGQGRERSSSNVRIDVGFRAGQHRLSGCPDDASHEAYTGQRAGEV